MSDKKEVTIEVRESGVSIQSAGIGRDNADAIKTLETALDALKSDDRQKETFTNEIVVNNGDISR